AGSVGRGRAGRHHRRANGAGRAAGSDGPAAGGEAGRNRGIENQFRGPRRMNIELPNAGHAPFEPQLQRYRDYARQRQMTLADLLLENRIIFFGSAGGSVFEPVITDVSANIVIQQLLYLQYENR